MVRGQTYSIKKIKKTVVKYPTVNHNLKDIHKKIGGQTVCSQFTVSWFAVNHTRPTDSKAKAKLAQQTLLG
jgi:hypothetical protein